VVGFAIRLLAYVSAKWAPHLASHFSGIFAHYTTNFVITTLFSTDLVLS